MKQRYQLSLDKEKVEGIKVWLKSRGLTFSGYINSLIDEQLNAIKVYKKYEKHGEVTASSFFKMAGDMVEKLAKEVKQK